MVFFCRKPLKYHSMINIEDTINGMMTKNGVIMSSAFRIMGWVCFLLFTVYHIIGFILGDRD